MTSFIGHVIVGSRIILISMWWCYAAYRNYFKSKCNGTPYYSTAWFLVERYPKLPLESIMKLLITAVAIVEQFVTGLDDKGVFVDFKQGQHISENLFFGIQAMVEILQFYNFEAIPTHAEYFTGILAFFMRGLVFWFHVHGGSSLDVLVHHLLIIPIAGCGILMTIESFVRSKVMVTLARSYWLLVQGTWLFHIAFILYPPLSWMKRWSLEDHQEMMLITMYFTWHCAVDFCIVLLIGGLVSLQYRKDLAMYREQCNK